MSTTDTVAVVRRALREVAPDANLDALGPDDDLRDTLHLDSLDFLRLVELLSEATSIRIDEEDYPRLETVATTVAFLSGAP